MRIALTLTPPTDLYFRWAAQIGVNDFVCRNPTHYGMDPISGLEVMKRRAEEFGLRMSVVEGYLPIERIVLGQDGRDAQIAELTAIIRQMGKSGVEVLCYNFMPFFDWTRTSFELPARGGAMTNGFDAAQIGDKLAPSEARLSSEQMWANLEYFLRRIVPVA